MIISEGSSATKALSVGIFANLENRPATSRRVCSEVRFQSARKELRSDFRIGNSSSMIILLQVRFRLAKTPRPRSVPVWRI